MAVAARVAAVSVMLGGAWLLVASLTMASCESQDGLGCSLDRAQATLAVALGVAAGVLGFVCLKAVASWERRARRPAALCAAILALVAVVAWPLYLQRMPWVPVLVTTVVLPLVVLPFVDPGTPFKPSSDSPDM